MDKLKAGTIELGKDIDYKDGKTMHNNVKHIFKETAKDTKSVFFITNGVVTFQPRDKINRGILEFDLNRFQDVKENDGTYTLKSIFDHRFQEGFKINLDLKKEFEQLEIKGEYLITKGKHVINFKSDAYTELEIKTKFDDEEAKKANEIEIVSGKKGKNEKASKNKKKKAKEKDDKKSKKTSKKENEVKKSNNTETKKTAKKTTTKSSGNKKEKDWDRIVRTYGVGGKK